MEIKGTEIKVRKKLKAKVYMVEDDFFPVYLFIGNFVCIDLYYTICHLAVYDLPILFCLFKRACP